MALPDFTTQDAATYKANIDSSLTDHESRLTSFRGALVKTAGIYTYTAGSGVVQIPFDSEFYDTDTIHDNTTNNTRLTVPTGVTYVRMMAYFKDTPANATNDTYIRIYKNGASMTPWLEDVMADTLASAATALHISSPPLQVVATDYFEMNLFSSSSGNLSVNSGIIWFGMEILE